MRSLALALTAATALIIPAVSHAQNAPLSSIFNCNNPNSRQGTGTLVGGVIGGVLGNQLAGDDDRGLGTVLGAAIGAGIGSYAGCNMTRDDGSRAETATVRALDQGRAATWSNGSTGVSGRVDIVNTFYRDNVSGRAPDYGYQPRSLNEVRFARGVQFPVSYDMSNAVYRTGQRTNVRAAPNQRATVLTTLAANQRFDALARVDNNWLLVGRNGVAVGYVAEWLVDFEAYSDYAYNDGYNGYNNGYRQTTDRELCRTFDQTVQRYGYRTTTERFTACKGADGAWRIQS